VNQHGIGKAIWNIQVKKYCIKRKMNIETQPVQCETDENRGYWRKMKPNGEAWTQVGQYPLKLSRTQYGVHKVAHQQVIDESCGFHSTVYQYLSKMQLSSETRFKLSRHSKVPHQCCLVTSAASLPPLKKYDINSKASLVFSHHSDSICRCEDATIITHVIIKVQGR